MQCVRRPKGRIGAVAFLATMGVATVFPYDTAQACRRASLPVCAPLYSCGPNCLHLHNNCGFGFRYHENLGGCLDQTGFVPAHHNVMIRGANCTLRAVTMC